MLLNKYNFLKHVTPEHKSKWESKNQVRIEFNDQSMNKYDLLITDCSDDLFEAVKNEINAFLKQTVIIQKHEFDELPGLIILLDITNYANIITIMIHLMILMMIHDGILLRHHQQQLLLNLPRSKSSSKSKLIEIKTMIIVCNCRCTVTSITLLITDPLRSELHFLT